MRKSLSPPFFAVVFAMAFLFVFLSFSALSDTDIPLEIINAGIRHYDGKVISVKFDGILDYVMSGDRYRVEYRLAYQGIKEFLSLYRQQQSTENVDELVDGVFTLEYIFDGKRTWWICKHTMFTQYNVITARNFRPDYDPRFYTSRSGENYHRHTLDEHLAKNGAIVIGEEIIETRDKKEVIREPCYLVAFENAQGTQRHWISMNTFRMMKYESISGDYQYHITIVYKQFPGDIWYPSSIKWDSSSYSPDGSKHPSNVGSMTLSNIEVNTDVSEFFEFHMPPDAEIFDFDTGKRYSAGEIRSK